MIVEDYNYKGHNMQLYINEEEISKYWEEERIQDFMQELNLSRLEAIIYLWSFNNISISKDDLKDLGRPMYIKFATSISDLIKEQTNKVSDENCQLKIKKIGALKAKE